MPKCYKCKKESVPEDTYLEEVETSHGNFTRYICSSCKSLAETEDVDRDDSVDSNEFLKVLILSFVFSLLGAVIFAVVNSFMEDFYLITVMLIPAPLLIFIRSKYSDYSFKFFQRVLLAFVCSINYFIGIGLVMVILDTVFLMQGGGSLGESLKLIFSPSIILALPTQVLYIVFSDGFYILALLTVFVLTFFVIRPRKKVKVKYKEIKK